MAHNTRPLKRAQDGVAPQYYNPTTDEYEALHGTAGANHVVIYGPDGKPASLATETKLEAVRALLALLEGKDFATDMKAEAIRLLLASLDGKDFASETTLAALEAELALMKAELAAIKENQTSGDQKVTLSGKKASVAYGDYGQALSVAAGNSTTITIKPPVGELWRIRLLRVLIPALVGATTGTHRLDTCLHSAQEALMTLIEPYNRGLNIVRNHMPSTTATTKEPADPTTQVRVITSLVCTNSVPLVLYYHNYSDATQAGNAVIRVVREVEYIND